MHNNQKSEYNQEMPQSHILQTNSWHWEEESKNEKSDTTFITLQKHCNTITEIFQIYPQKTRPHYRINTKPLSNSQTLIPFSERQYVSHHMLLQRAFCLNYHHI